MTDKPKLDIDSLVTGVMKGLVEEYQADTKTAEALVKKWTLEADANRQGAVAIALIGMNACYLKKAFVSLGRADNEPVQNRMMAEFFKAIAVEVHPVPDQGNDFVVTSMLVNIALGDSKPAEKITVLMAVLAAVMVAFVESPDKLQALVDATVEGLKQLVAGMEKEKADYVAAKTV